MNVLQLTKMMSVHKQCYRFPVLPRALLCSCQMMHADNRGSSRDADRMDLPRDANLRGSCNGTRIAADLASGTRIAVHLANGMRIPHGMALM